MVDEPPTTAEEAAKNRKAALRNALAHDAGPTSKKATATPRSQAPDEDLCHEVRRVAPLTHTHDVLACIQRATNVLTYVVLCGAVL